MLLTARWTVHWHAESGGPHVHCELSMNALTLKLLATPDGRYIVVRGRLWRAANPGLAPDLHAALVRDLMQARRDIREAGRAADAERLAAARAAVHAAKVALGERGPVWWTDGAKDFNRHLVKNTPYAGWFSAESPAPGI